MPSFPRIHFGAAYYPEHWPEERWPEDVRLMKEAYFTVVRMGEFAWSMMEPSAGNIQLDWLARAVQLFAENEIVSVLGTPTAAPPAWLTYANPDTLAVDSHGRRVQHGNRCHYCPTSPDVIEASRRIVTAMAERFGSEPSVIGWQTDNELGRVCYCERCHRLFQEFLQQRYETLDNLNQRWSTAYWSQTYSAWEQIPIPIGPHNPGLMLEWMRFITKVNTDFQRVQVDVLRRYIPEGVWVTHNFMGWFDGFDHYAFSKDIDIASWDAYVGTGHHDYTFLGAYHDMVRGFKNKNFWIMETQPGTVNWSPINNALYKWEARAMAWQAVAHGAEGFLYWQWRPAPGGQEQYHGSLIDHSGQPRPFYQEAQQIGKEFAALSELVAGAKPARTRIAMLNSYESRWSLQWQPHHKDFDYVAYFNSFYRPLAARNLPVDVIGAETLVDARQLNRYKLVILPALAVVDEQLLNVLRDFLTCGGCLVFTARCGIKDRYNALQPNRQPGILTELTGVEVEEYYALNETVPVKANWFEGHSRIWAERLRIKLPNVNTSVLAKYGPSNGWLDGQIAIAASAYGTGMIYYMGTNLDDTAQQKLFERILSVASLKAPVTPVGVEMRTLVNPAGEEVVIVINHTPQPQTVTLPWPAVEHLSGLQVPIETVQPPYGVAVLTKLPPPPPAEAPAEELTAQPPQPAAPEENLGA
ncbi:MAG: beta-galactosidase [Chloroflexota bacterium]